MSPAFPSVSFPAIGTTVTVVTTNAARMAAAVEVVRAEVAALDAAASRFRPDSELSRANGSAGRAVSVSRSLIGAVEDALRAAVVTDGLVSPTVGGALICSGYDRDFRALSPDGPPVTVKLRSVPGWQRVRVDRIRGTLTVPPGVVVDLGATAKAGCADRAAARASELVDCGVLVNLGGDLAVVGPAPVGGWPVRVADRHDAPTGVAGVTVAIRTGGMATSGTMARRWCRGGQVLHHIIDPRTGSSAVGGWRTATVVARSCLEANTASTAAVVLGPKAPAWLAERGLHARLVSDDGATVFVGGWPRETGPASLNGPTA
jgi:FAD:protein FMN transferase